MQGAVESELRCSQQISGHWSHSQKPVMEIRGAEDHRHFGFLLGNISTKSPEQRYLHLLIKLPW